MKNISRFIDKDDYVKELTKDDVVNIIGSKGSGKTTSTIKYIDDDDYIVVNLDSLHNAPGSKERDKELDNIRKLLIDKYGSIKDDEEFITTYNEIVKYAKDKKKKLLIEGNSIQGIEPKDLKGTVIVKRTATVKCYIRSVKRDYHNEYFMNLEKEKHKHIYKLTRFKNISKRRKKIFKEVKELDEYIDKLKSI